MLSQCDETIENRVKAIFMLIEPNIEHQEGFVELGRFLGPVSISRVTSRRYVAQTCLDLATNTKKFTVPCTLTLGSTNCERRTTRL